MCGHQPREESEERGSDPHAELRRPNPARSPRNRVSIASLSSHAPEGGWGRRSMLSGAGSAAHGAGRALHNLEALRGLCCTGVHQEDLDRSGKLKGLSIPRPCAAAHAWAAACANRMSTRCGGRLRCEANKLLRAPTLSTCRYNLCGELTKRRPAQGLLVGKWPLAARRPSRRGTVTVTRRPTGGRPARLHSPFSHGRRPISKARCMPPGQLGRLAARQRRPIQDGATKSDCDELR